VGRGASPAHIKAGELVATGRRKAPLRSLSFESAARFTSRAVFVSERSDARVATIPMIDHVIA
jgi:hypothetical protein